MPYTKARKSKKVPKPVQAVPDLEHASGRLQPTARRRMIGHG